MRKILGVLLLALSLSEVSAQREVMYEQYLQNPMAINPAFTGARGDFNMTALFRRKWFTIRNSPSSQTFAADGLTSNGRWGIGFQALNDQTSYFTTTGVYGSVAYHLDMSDIWKLSLGGQGGINVLPIVDIGASGNNRALGSFGVGARLFSNNFYLGISKPELLNQNFGNQRVAFFYRRPLYIKAGGSYDLAEDLLLLPYAMVVQEKQYSLRVDFGAKLWVHEKIGVGASYRVGGKSQFADQPVDYLQLSAELQVGRNVRFGYFFSTRQTEQSLYNTQGPQGIHELMLKFIPSPVGFQKF
ncbi:type IX secretion system PorP/SprF family membrane protein [Dyadobacter jejuensis]|uniref:Type IX secretion system PorP/SprF family membrane protein n=1 Tax=Dyadobacter jejuensis TaxID=1082580 RepID=A0A316AKT7_9BACT|nr:type IX secretion system membrane protein PorP/SprF [Dyadobacter jejuensis]PWJ58405.1 type IX secretion system PorP/SprF family membrane protein [Dyadobacter jejuensis]